MLEKRINSHENVGDCPNNPSSSDIDTETQQKLRGDAIGDTLYSESFVVKTLMRLSNEIQWGEDLENDLCFLWDSTLEEDVCEYLIKLNFVGIACDVISASNESRLIEILIGILGNICCKGNAVSDEQIESVLTSVSSDDPLILIQVMRFIKGISFHMQRLEFLTDDLLGQIEFILNNSVNNELLVAALDAAAKFTAYNKIEFSLLNGDLVKSSCVAYSTCKNCEKVNVAALTFLVQIVSNICTYINESESDRRLLSDVNAKIELFLVELDEFFDFYSVIDNLLPVEHDNVYIIDALVSVFQILQVKYRSGTFKNLTIITSVLIKNEWEDLDMFLEFVCYFIFAGELYVIKDDLKRLTHTDVLLVLDTIKGRNEEYQFSYKPNFDNLYEKYAKD